MRSGTARAADAIAAVVLSCLLAEGAGAQTFGVVGGRTEARQLQTRGDDSGTHTGFLAGAWLDTATPAGWLSVTAEAVFARRGGSYPVGAGLEGPVEVDYLSVAVLPTARVGVGPVALMVFAGPTVETYLRSRAAVELEPVFRDATGQVVGLAAGGGLAIRRGRAILRLEARLSEQLSSAFKGDAPDVRHRTTEIVVRLGMRPGG